MRVLALLLLIVHAAHAGGGFTLNAELLERYGWTLERYNALTPPEQRRLEEWLQALEEQRLAARPSGKNPLASADEKSLERLRLGAGFDSKAPSIDVPSVVPEVSLTGGQFRRFSLLGKDSRADFGLLGADGQSPLLAPSPYLNFRSGGQSSGPGLDTSWAGQAGVVRLGARLFPDDAPALDRKIDDALSAVPGGAKIAQDTRVPTGFERETLFVGSYLGQFGRAYHLLGPLDAAWSAMGEMRMTGLLPNAALDQSGALRLKLGGSSLAATGGLSEGVGLFARDMAARSLQDESAAFSPSIQKAPHASVMAWGKLPYVSGAQYELEAGRQWNPWTVVQTAAAGVSVESRGSVVGLKGSYSDESGPDAEFRRTKSAATVTYSPSPGLELFGQAAADTARLGTAQVENRSVVLGLTLTETQPGPGFGRATMVSRIGGQDALVSEEQVNRFANQLQFALALLRAAKDAGTARVGGTQGAYDAARDAWSGLDPALRGELEAAWRTAAPSAPPLSRLFSASPRDIAAYDKLFELASDTDALDRLMTRYLRRSILDELEGVKVPLLGRKVRLSAPMVVAAAHAYSLSLTPLPGITAADARGSLDPFLMKKLSDAAGCDKNGDAAALTDCLLKDLQPAERAQLQKAFGGDLSRVLADAVSWPADIIRREIDAAMLQVMIAAEKLNELTGDGGERLSALNDRALRRSFDLLDARDRERNKTVFVELRRARERDVAAEDAALRARLADYGASRLAWLQSQPSWPAGVRVAVRSQDWPRLLAIHGDAAVFDLILRAKARLVERGRSGLMIAIDDTPLGGLSIVDGEPMRLILPPRKLDLSHVSL